MIRYVREDVFTPGLFGLNVLIPHIVNDAGKFGAGFTAAIDKHMGTEPRLAYFSKQLKLGETDFVPVLNKATIAHMCAQHGVGRANKPIRYEALERCMEHVAEYAASWYDDLRCMTIRAPRFGSGLAGGTWNRIEPMIEKYWGHMNVTICDLP